MGLSKLSSGWFSPSFWCQRRPRKHFCRRQPWRLALELLEDRLVPTTDLDVGGLHFYAPDGFEEASGDYFVKTGTVSIGYTKAGINDPFKALVQAKVLQSTGAVQNAFFILNANQAHPTFELSQSELDLVVVGDSPSIPLPIWRSTEPDFSETFDIDELKTTGVQLEGGDSEPITVADVDFTVSNLLFNNPDSGSTANAQVKMQGDASFDKVPLVKDLGISAHVGGPNDPQNNYVIADHTGIILTGMDVTKDLGTKKVAGLAVSGQVIVGYEHDNNKFSFRGAVQLTSEAQENGKVALDNVGAALEVAVTDGKLETFGFGITTGFNIFDLNVSTANGQPINVTYNAGKDQFQIQGGLQLEFNFNTVSVNLEDGKGGPGIVIENGKLTQFQAIVNADFQLFGANVKATNLTFEYTADNGHGQSQFEMYGDLSLILPNNTVISAHLGTQGDPGLILQNGTLTQINMGVTGSFDVFGFQIGTAGANLEWQKMDNSFLIYGGFTADFKVFQASVTLGHSPKTGLSIKDGQFQLTDAKFVLDNAELGPVTLEQLLVQWTENGSDFDLKVAGMVLLPGGWEVHAALGFVNKQLDSIAVSASFGDGFPVGDTGLFITELGGSIQNLDNPSQIIVTGHLGVTWGDTFTLFGNPVKLFRAEGDITVDANELILSGSVQIGAYSTDGGTTWQAVAGSGDAKLTLDWGDKLYSLHVDVKGLFVIFDLSGDMTFNAGKEIKFLATADVVIPNEVPFIGGDKIAGVGFYFDHVFAHTDPDGTKVPTSTTVAAWIGLHIIWDFEVGFEKVYDKANPNGSFSLIGAKTIDNFKAGVIPPMNPNIPNPTYTYTADLAKLVPATATSATLSADWSKVAPGVTIVGQPKFRVQRTVNGVPQPPIPEDQFAANGIQFIDDPHFSSPTSKAIQIVGSTKDAYTPITSDYKLLVDVTTTGGNPFPDYPNPNAADVLKVQATWHVPKPTFGPRNAGTYVPVVTQTSSDTYSVTLQGTADDAFLQPGSKAQVSLYRVLVQDPQQRAVLIGTKPLTQVQGNGVNWQAKVDVPVDGLYPLPYTVYAVVSDGFNVPVKSVNSTPFTPLFAVIGSVSNQNDDAKTGWSVWLDYNQDNKRQDNEPIYQTSNPGGFYAFTPTFDPKTGWGPVPTGKDFDVRLIVPAPNNFDPVGPQTIQYDGQNTKAVPFVVQEKSAIKGTVFDDVHGTGLKQDGTPIPGATVYLDVNHDGHRDPGDPTTLTDVAGHYDFANQAPGTYTVALDLDSLGGGPVAAYNVPAGTVGQSISFLQSFGMDFDVTEPIRVTSLGLFDSGQSGWDTNFLPYFAYLYDRRTQQPLASVSFTTDDPGTLVGGSRFKALSQPLLLPAGFQGTITGDNQGGSKRFGSWNDQSVTWTTNNGQGAVNFVGSGRFGEINHFPEILDHGPANAYAAGSFIYNPVWIATSPPSGTYSVTIDNSGHDLKEGNDFGAAQPSSLSGTITGHQVTDGRLDPASQPLGGWTVNLRQNGAVVATTTTADDGSYVFDGLRPGTYNVDEVVQPNLRALAPSTGSLQLQKPGPAETWSWTGYGPLGVVTADFDGNGQLDFAVVAQNGSGMSGATDPVVRVFYNGDFSHPVDLQGGVAGFPVKLAAGDFLGNGRPDLALLYEVQDNNANNVIALLPNVAGRIQNGALSWTLPIIQDGCGPMFYTDLVTGHFFQSSPVHDQLAAIASGQGGDYAVVAFTATGSDFQQSGLVNGLTSNLAAGDINGDGITDLFVGNSSGSPTVFYGDGSGNFRTTTISALPTAPSVLVGDINGDGKLDLGVFGFQGNVFSYALQTASGSFPTAIASGVGIDFNETSGAVLVDVNGDFRPDVVWTMSDLPSVYVALNTGTPGQWFTPAQQTSWPLATTLGGFPYTLAAGDFNHDGFNDLAIADFTNELVEVVYNRSTVQAGSITVSLQSGESATGKDFVNAHLPASGITGDVFEDRNRDGSKNAAESGQAGSFVFLDTNRNGQYDPGEPVTTTVAEGAYAFDNLADGTYRVGVLPDFGKVITSAGGGFQDVTVQGGAVTGVDFGQSDRLLQLVADQHVTVGTTLAVAPGLTTAGTTGGRLVFALEPGAPAGASIDPLTGRITWTPTAPGQFPITVRVRDPFQPVRTETVTFLVTVSQVPPVLPPAAPTGPFAVPVLERLVVNRNRRRGYRAQVLGATLIFNVPLNLDPRALRLVRHRPGNRKQDLSRWIQTVMVVHNGQTWAYLRFRSPRGALLPRGRYSLVLQNDLLRNALTGASLAAPGGGALTELRW
jgi:hypothetical protein